MLNTRQFITLLALAFLLTAVACAPQVQVQEKVVKETVVVVEKEEVRVEVVVTATPAPPPAPKRGGTLIAARTGEVGGLDPHTNPAFTSLRFFELVYNSLVRLDKDLSVASELAESWTVSEDGKTLTFKLRPDVRFHNGDILTSEDVKFTFERILNEETGAVARSFFTDITAVEAPDPTTVVMRLSRPNAALLTLLTSPNASIVSKKVAESGDLTRDVVGTGAFRLAEWEPDNFMRLEANPDFFIDGQPLLDAIELRVIPDEASILAGLRAGTLDWALIQDPKTAILATSSGDLTVMRTPSLSYHLFGLNTTREPFDDPRVRQAISCAINRQEIVDVAALGEGRVTPPLTQPNYALPTSDLPCYTPNLEKAKGLLAEAGLAEGFKFKIMVAIQEPATALAEAQVIQAQLKPLGIETEIENLELGNYVDRWLKADFDAWVGLNSGNPDPDFMLYRYWHSTGNLNFVPGYTNPDIDRWLDQAKATVDATERKALYDQVQMALVEAAPWVWTYVGFEYHVLQPYVKGFTPLSTGSIMYLRETWLDK